MASPLVAISYKRSHAARDLRVSPLGALFSSFIHIAAALLGVAPGLLEREDPLELPPVQPRACRRVGAAVAAAPATGGCLL